MAMLWGRRDGHGRGRSLYSSPTPIRLINIVIGLMVWIMAMAVGCWFILCSLPPALTPVRRFYFPSTLYIRACERHVPLQCSSVLVRSQYRELHTVTERIFHSFRGTWSFYPRNLVSLLNWIGFRTRFFHTCILWGRELLPRVLPPLGNIYRGAAYRTPTVGVFSQNWTISFFFVKPTVPT